MTYEEAIAYISSHSFSRWKLGLERERELMERLDNPQKTLRFVHVAGSNGKGSTCAMIERILRGAGYKTGFFPSPYIETFRERIRVGGDLIPEARLSEITARVRKEADAMADHPTQFELITAIGLLFFAEEACDIVVLETGLGGEYDATNIIDAPEVAVLTNIGLEHTEYLGDTLAKIAATKSGIIKEGCDVVCYDNVPEVTEVVRRVSAEKGCPLTFAAATDIRRIEESLSGQTFTYLPQEKTYRLSLPGVYQLRNVCTALHVIDVLRARGFAVPEQAVREGLAKVSWPARFEVLKESPLLILDGGHNPQCAEALTDSLRTYLTNKQTDGGIVFLTGILKDKNVDRVLDIILPFAKCFVCVTPASDRAMEAKDLADRIASYGKEAACAPSVAAGLKQALGKAAEDTDGVVVAFGSLYMAGEVRIAFRAMAKSTAAPGAEED